MITFLGWEMNSLKGRAARRNAQHWGKTKSFIADHAETGTLLMGAPQHLKTLETIRASC